MKLIYLIMIFLPLSSYGTEKITEIKVLNTDFEIIRVITEPQDLSKATQQWESLIPITNLPNYNWSHKLDVKSQSKSVRWLYNQEGFIVKLNIQLKPIYRVNDVQAFNKVYLGL